MATATIDRTYSPERVQRLVLAMWKAMLLALMDEDRSVVIRSEEVLAATALIDGMCLAANEDCKLPSRLREICEEQAKAIAKRTRQVQARGKTLFDVVLPAPEDFQ